MAYKIYSVEDDKDIARIINLTLSKQGYDVKTFSDGVSFKQAFKESRPDLILLDLMLPDTDGFQLIKEIRKDKANDAVQIMIVSAKNQLIDKVDGLDFGADDYLEKPFEILELISRVNAKFRRYEQKQVLTIGNIKVDNNSHICYLNNVEVPLTNTEFLILYTLMLKKGTVVSRDDLLKLIWGGNQAYESRTIDVHVKSLRDKLQEEGKHIVSVYGIGYRYTE
ncbi:MAG: response regulator transcription factor [Bacilli bacterium]|jgi:two-component system alkaline phosphatase synthesis response regulator PhoP